MWNPETHPYRLSITRRTNAPGMHGWRSDTRTYPTLADAQAEFSKPQGKGVISVEIDQAMNPATWSKNGRWKLLQKRGRLGKKH